LEVSSPEWANAKWQNEAINLSAYAGKEVRLRFSLTVNDEGSDRGWVIDEVIVGSGTSGNTRIFLPIVLK
jgi:hypothetical protein